MKIADFIISIIADIVYNIGTEKLKVSFLDF